MTARAGPRVLVIALALALAACGGGGSHAMPDAPHVPGHALGMNDVSTLLPLPVDPATPTLLAMTGLVPEVVYLGLIDRIGPKNGLPIAYDDFQVVAVRVDLCERAVVGPCAPGEDGRLRLVLQPMYQDAAGATLAHDIGIHLFFRIPSGELAAVIAELRELAAVQDVPTAAPLGVSPAPPAYLDGLRALVTRYAVQDQLVRATIIGQNKESAAFAWFFKGYDRGTDGPYDWDAITIPAVDETRESVLVAGGDTVYQTEPLADDPPGLALAINGGLFAGATADEQRGAIEALTAIDNPEVHDAVDTQCFACHVATFLTARRSEVAGLDPTTIAGRFTSPYDTTVDTIAGTDPRVVRGFGWASSFPAISQRVANDTARTLAEIDARFPP